MATVNLPNTAIIKGNVYFRTKVNGRQGYVRLPSPKSPEFAMEYQKQADLLKADRIVADRTAPRSGTFAALIKEYRGSAKYGELKKTSKANTDHFLELIAKRFGDKPVAKLSHRTIDKLQDELKDTPGKANKYISQMSVLLALGLRRGYCDKNVAQGTDRLKGGEHDPWPADVIEAVLAVAKPHYALGIISGLCSGQRVSDCVLMEHTMIEDGMMTLRQQKTGKDVFIPMHPIWAQAISALPQHRTILYDGRGRPYTTEGVQAYIRRLMKGLGYVDKDGQAAFTFHGLRKNSANILAEIGCTPHEISSITGMSLQMVMHYTRAVSMKLVAQRIAERYRQASLPGVLTGSNLGVNSPSDES